MTHLEEEICNRIKKMMKDRKINQSSLAIELGVHQYDVSRLLNGKPFPSIDQLVKIAEVLDCSLYYLLGIQEQSYRELNPDAAKVASAYSQASEPIQEIIKRVLDI